MSRPAKSNIWGDLPADPRALRLSIEELERAEGLCLHEIENEVSYLESVDLVLHEVKRLHWRPIETAPIDGTVVLGYGPHKTRGHYIDAVHCWNALGRPVWTISYMDDHAAPTHWMPLPPAPCDEPRDGGDGLPAPGRSPAGAVAEGQAPDLKALQAEIERLKNRLEFEMRARRAAEQATAANVQALQYALTDTTELRTALAENERKAAIITSAAAEIIGVALTARRKNTHEWMAGLAEDINKAAAVVGSRDRFAYDGRDHIERLPKSTPTQETPDVTG